MVPGPRRPSYRSAKNSYANNLGTVPIFPQGKWDCPLRNPGSCFCTSFKGHPGIGGSGLTFYQRDYIENCLHHTHPIVAVEEFQRVKP